MTKKKEETTLHEYRVPGRRPRREDLKPGHTYVLYFKKGLPETLQKTATRYPKLPEMGTSRNPKAYAGPAASFYLPAGYSRRRRTPLFVWLHGGYGGPGNIIGDAEKELADGTGCILVNMPLFKAKLKAKPRNMRDMFLHAADYPVMSAAYKKILSIICRIIPYVDPKRSVLGGFSHGAQATAILVGFSDPCILSNFRSFLLVDQGYFTMLALANENNLKKHNIMLMVAQKGKQPVRKIFLQSSKWIADSAKKNKLHIRRVVMKRQPHSFPKRYRRVAVNWINKVNSPRPKR
jgi:hypothetical protein